MANENQHKFLVATTDLFFNMTKVDDFESIEEITNDYHEFSVDGKLAILVREESMKIMTRCNSLKAYGVLSRKSTRYSSSEMERPVASLQREA
mgnify:CR=1 FL=1